MERLRRSLSELRIRLPMPLSALTVVLHEIVRRNRVDDGVVYLQVTRGVARREHAFPSPEVAPSIVASARRLDRSQGERLAQAGIAVITLPETRWARVDIKSIALLPNVLARQAAREQGAREAWFVDRDGHITEGAASNAWITAASAVREILMPKAEALAARSAFSVMLTVLRRAFTSYRGVRMGNPPPVTRPVQS